jgi:hypothetical protein
VLPRGKGSTMKRTTLAGMCAALVLAGLAAPPATAGKPVPAPPSATITNVTVGPYFQDPYWPGVNGCRETITARITGISSNLVAKFFIHIEDPGTSPWLDISQPLALTRGDQVVAFTTYAPLKTTEFPHVRGFVVEVGQAVRGSWRSVVKSPEYRVAWTESTCQPN